MTKPVYSIDAPHQAKLKQAKAEIEAVLSRYDLAGVVTLHTPGMTEFFYSIRPTYSCAWIEGDALRLKSKRADYESDAAFMHDRLATASMSHGLAEDLANAAAMFGGMARVIDSAFGAEHAEAVLRPDPNESNEH